ncbi:hypothetical protein EsVE80_13370 [Enterococcus saigonensis]|uniref:Hydrolase n=1 Tax=Enterococcus saigonensis TaxID=1805431 RepID=A0A679IPN3_9ENTE|nr:hypothetical protein [Enterococcus saigonensis]BCA85814.1 hypothetical protein EsVE80_13370 [Enterococcus saigonensis]
MGEKIDFPDELKRHIRLAKKAIEEKEYLVSIRYLQKAYEMDMSFEINQLYTEALLKCEDFESALQIAQDFIIEYQQTTLTLTKYVRILLLNQHFLKARKLILQSVFLTNEQTKTFIQQVNQLEAAVDLLDPENIQQKRQWLNSWDEKGAPVITADWEAFQRQVTYRQFIAMMQDFLPKSKNDFLRPRLIEELVLLKCDKTITCSSWDGKATAVNLMEITLPEKVASYQELKKYFETEVAAQDSQMAEFCLNELNAQLAITYPFVPFVSDTKKWGESYILEYQAMMGSKRAKIILQNFADITEQKAQIRQIYQKNF